MLNLDAFKVLTFDCYGTLIDWEAGLLNALQPILTVHGVSIGADDILETYAELEAAAERGVYRDYRSVLRGVLEGMGARLGFQVTPSELEQFPFSVKNWPAFPDSPRALQALKRKFKLAILSNIDDDLFAFSNQRLDVEFDWIVTAKQVQSYKPALINFQKAIERIGLPRQQILHVAQSLFHDIMPAKSLGLATVWVNRRQGKSGFGATPPAQASPDLEVPDLETLARLAGTL